MGKRMEMWAWPLHFDNSNDKMKNRQQSPPTNPQCDCTTPAQTRRAVIMCVSLHRSQKTADKKGECRKWSRRGAAGINISRAYRGASLTTLCSIKMTRVRRTLLRLTLMSAVGLLLAEFGQEVELEWWQWQWFPSKKCGASGGLLWLWFVSCVVVVVLLFGAVVCMFACGWRRRKLWKLCTCFERWKS